MSPTSKKYVIFSDVHYAGPSETRRGLAEAKINAPIHQKAFVSFYRNFLWLADPIYHAKRFHQLIGQINHLRPNEIIYLGDLTMDTAFVGLSDPASLESAKEFIDICHSNFQSPMNWVMGDHELGKTSIIGKIGGPRIDSLSKWTDELNMPMHWISKWNRWTIISLCSTLAAFPVYAPEFLPNEQSKWEAAQKQHLDWIKSTFSKIAPDERIVLLCHDPSALGFLSEINEVQEKMNQIAVTWVGHMHTSLVAQAAQIFSGVPEINFLGTSIRRFSIALNRAKIWKDFRMKLCPSPSGSEAYRDGGFFEMILYDDDEKRYPTCVFHPNPW